MDKVTCFDISGDVLKKMQGERAKVAYGTCHGDGSDRFLTCTFAMTQ